MAHEVNVIVSQTPIAVTVQQAGGLVGLQGPTGPAGVGLTGVTGLAINTGPSLIGALTFVEAGTVALTTNGNSVTVSGSASASSDTASNLGDGSGIFSSKSAGDFKFKSLKAGSNISFTGDSNTLTIISTAAGGSNSDGINLSGDLTNTGSILNNRIISLSGDLYLTGKTLNDRIVSLSGDLYTTGKNLYTGIAILSGNLITSGSDLNNKIISLSGDLAATGSILNNRILSLSGDLYSTGKSLENIYIKLTGVAAISGVKTFNDSILVHLPANNFNYFELRQSGITTLKLVANTGGYFHVYDSSGTGAINIYDRILSGNWDVQNGILTVNGQKLSTSGDLTATGQILINQIISLSGDVYSTGNILNNRILSLSGDLRQTGINLTNYINLVSGNLISTGDILWNRIKSLSGDLQTTGSNLQSQITTLNNLSKVTGISANSGNSLTGLINFSSAGTITLNIAGNNIEVSGAAAASSDTASNIGFGSGVFASKVGGDFQFKSIFAGSNISITGTNNTLTIIGSASTANVTDVVYTSGVQTISGNKTFQGGNILLNTGNILGSGTINVTHYFNTGTANFTLNSGVQITTSGVANAFTITSSSVGQLLNVTDSVDGLIFQVNQSGTVFAEVYSNSTGVVKLGNITTNDFILTGGQLGLGSGIPRYRLDVSGYISTNKGIYTPLITGESGAGAWVSTGFNFLQRPVVNNIPVLLVGEAGANFGDGINLSGNLQSTGSILNNRIISLSGDLYVTGNNLWNRMVSLSGDLASTGNILNNRIISLSGDLYSTGKALENIYIKLTGVGFISGVKTFNDSVIINLPVFEAKKLSITQSGYTVFEIYANGLNTGSFVMTDASGTGAINVYNRILSGAWNAASEFTINGQKLALSGDLTSTGNILNNRIISLSGDLAATGTTLNNAINVSYNRITSLSGDLYQTGSNLWNRIISLSGDLATSGSNLSSRINPFVVTGISVTGGNSITGLISLTGSSGLSVIQSANTINYVLPNFSKNITLDYPQTDDSITMFFTDTALKLNKVKTLVSGFQIGSTQPNIQFNIAIYTGNNVAQIGNIFNSTQTVSGTHTGDLFTSFATGTITENTWSRLNIVASGGDMRKFSCSLLYNYI